MFLGRFGAACRHSAGAGARLAAGCVVVFGALLFAAPAMAQVKPPPTSSTPVKCLVSGDVPPQELTAGGPALIVGDDSKPNNPVICKVKPGKNYYYGNVNVVAGGQLVFDENDGPGVNSDFWASSIIIEKDGALIAQNSAALPSKRFGAKGAVLTIHLWGANRSIWNETNQAFTTQNQGALCKSATSAQIGPCGIPLATWTSNGGSRVAIPGLGGDGLDYFYQYGPLYGDGQCSDGSIFDPKSGKCGAKGGGQVGYFGNKVLAVSYGGSLLLSGYKGTTDVDPASDPTNSGVSWMRLKDGSNLDKGASLTLEKDPGDKWKTGDEFVVTTSDYLPGHSEKLTIGSLTGPSVAFSPAIQWPHNGVRYGGPNDAAVNRWCSTVKADGTCDTTKGGRLQSRIQTSLANDLLVNGAETRAAVALLSRSIRIVSGGDTPGAANDFPPFDPTTPCVKDDGIGPCYSYGAQMIVRQGFKALQISGVEFKQMGQGGRMGHYPVHFHMARQTPPNTYIVDSSVNESMTRWYVIHATLGVTLARNVGYMSIGHGYYLEAGSETDNNLYSNIGILARGAVKNAQNPRHVPGILADNQDPTSAPFASPNVPNPGMPYRSDNEYPTIFWITNGWNDFIGNMAAGATTCGAGYWFAPAANSDAPEIGSATQMTWTGYAALQKGKTYAGTTPLKSFFKNSATSSMHSFQTTADAPPCDGIVAANVKLPGQFPVLPAVKSISPKPVRHTIVPQPPSTDPPHTEPDDFSDFYYPHMLGGARRATYCPSDGQGGYNCSAVDPCANGPAEERCGVTVLDHYTSSFHWAQGNVSAIWLRPQWYLLDNSVLTDVQNGGYTIITGGDYTHSSIITGFWGLARNSIFVGNTRDNQKYPFASNIGPFNGTSGLKCDALGAGQGVPPYCVSSPQAVSMPFGAFFTNQRLNNIYDGPAYQDSNAYLDVKTADCAVGGYNGGCMYGVGIPFLLLRKIPGNQSSGCYLPNAAIAWKQPNGFYYPPAFHSANLQFDNVDIRHFVIDPLFQAPAGVTGDKDFGQGGTYISANSKALDQYCYGGPNVFNGWTAIDRQTELNDDDGSLTGLLNINPDPAHPLPSRVKQTISVNEDTYFGAPIETAECLSAAGATGQNNTLPGAACKPVNSTWPPPTVKTSPYDYVSTVVYHPESGGVWDKTCSNQNCYGVPLYRQYLTGTKGTNEASSTREWAHWFHNGCDKDRTTPQCRWPFIRMAGTDLAQRQTMTVNNGSYYIDTTVSLATQKAEPLNIAGAASNYNVFTAGQSYSVFFLYAKPSTIQTYQIYVGTDFNTNGGFQPIRVNFDTTPFTTTPVSGTPAWVTPDYSQVASKGILTVRMNFSSVGTELTPSPANDLCQPHTFCKPQGSDCVGALQDSDPIVKANPKMKSEADTICKNWAMKDLDCPKGGCFGFSFTLNGYTGDSANHRPATLAFPETNSDPSNPQGAPDWTTKFTNTSTLPDSASGGGKCSYTTLPDCPR